MTALVPNFMTDGSIMDLAAARPDQIDFAEMANGLSKIARFNGRYSATAYSVAQHSVIGADVLYLETGDSLIAGYFLLHDGHEYLVGDISRPMALLTDLMLVHVLEERGILGIQLKGAVKDAIEYAKSMLDAAIYSAANLLPPEKAPYYTRFVKAMDERMLVAECRQLYGAKAAIPLADNGHPPLRLHGSLKSWGPAKAELLFVDRLEKYLGIVVRPGALRS